MSFKQSPCETYFKGEIKMKDLTKKLLCLLVALAMVFVLCACGGDKDDDDDDDKKGKDSKPTTSQTADEDEDDKKSDKDDTLDSMEGYWDVSFNISDFAGMMGLEDEDMMAIYDAIDAEFNLVFGFTEDEVSLLVDADDMEAFADDVIDGMVKYFKDGGIYDYFKATMDFDKEDVDSLLEGQDLTLDELCDQMAEEMAASFDMSALTESADQNEDGLYIIEEGGEYSFDGEVLEIEGEELEVSYKNGVLTVKSASGDAAYMKGLKFEKRD